MVDATGAVEVVCNASVLEETVRLTNYKNMVALKKKNEDISVPIATFRGEYKFFLMIYPAGDVSSDDDSLAIWLKFEGPASLMYKYSFTLKATGEGMNKPFTQFEESTSEDARSPSQKWGWKNFCKKEKLKKAEVVLIEVRIEISDPDFVVKLKSASLSSQSNLEILSQEFGRLFETGDCADTVVSIQGKDQRVHSGILAARSPIFKAMFTSGFKENADRKVQIDDCDFKTGKRFLMFLYDGVLDTGALSQDECVELLKIGKKYGVSSLVDHVGFKLANLLSLENCACLITLADRYSCVGLREAAVKFATRDMKTLASVQQTEGFRDLDVDCMRAMFAALAPPPDECAGEEQKKGAKRAREE